MKTSRWQRFVLLGVGFGAGFAIVLSSIAATIFYISTRPPKAKPWNTAAIIARATDLYMTTNKDAMFAEYHYVLENHTNADYRLPSNDSIYKLLPQGKGLESDPACEWANQSYIPAAQRVNVTIRMKYEYDPHFTFADSDDNKKLTAFMARRLAEIAGFVVLDQSTRYQINFPKPVGPGTAGEP